MTSKCFNYFSWKVFNIDTHLSSSVRDSELSLNLKPLSFIFHQVRLQWNFHERKILGFTLNLSRIRMNWINSSKEVQIFCEKNLRNGDVIILSSGPVGGGRVIWRHFSKRETFFNTRSRIYELAETSIWVMELGFVLYFPCQCKILTHFPFNELFIIILNTDHPLISF